MREIVRILCGSHLHGTNGEESDRDYKIIYIPDGRSILLQQAKLLDPRTLPEIVGQLKQDAKITGDPDVEFLSLHRYLKILCKGQINALDMLFAPESFYVGQPEPEWYAIRKHTERWISKRSIRSGFHRPRIKDTSDINTKGWKDLSHCVRISEQALELVRTGHITFPRPEKDLLIDIKQGRVPLERAEGAIDATLQTVKRRVDSSALPEQSDWDFADFLVEGFYKSAVK